MTQPDQLVVHATSALIDGSWREAWIGVTDGVIVTVSGSPIDGADCVELADDEVLIPGIVDTHVHINEPGRTDWEGFASATRAAAAGGVTTLIDMPLNSVPVTTTVAALEAKAMIAAEKAIVDVGFWGGAVPENLGTLRALHEAGVYGFKAFLTPSGIDEFGHLDFAQLEASLAEIASFGGLLIVHAEDPSVLDFHTNDGGVDYRAFVRSRPDQSETAAIEHVISGVRRTGARAHILHLSSIEALPALRAARAEGLPITVETCPHYLCFTSEQIAAGETQFKCCPPIRSAANRDGLWQALLDGDIDIIVTDHSPSTAVLKFAGDGDFGAAWGGIAGLQLGLAAVWTEARRRDIPLEKIVKWMSTATADFAGMTTKGRIAPGAQADLVVFAPEQSFTVRAAELLHRNAVSAYDGRQLQGVVRQTFLAGNRVSTAPDAAVSGRVCRAR